MNKAERRARATLLLEKLGTLRDEWEQASKNSPVTSDAMPEAPRRERLKVIEAETALLRLMQSEDRLILQLAVGVLSFIGGSAITLLLKVVLG